MSLLQICQDAAAEIGVSRPASVVGATSVDAARLLRFANRVGRDLASRCAWQALRALHTVTATATEEQSGAIPAGFLRFSTETMWNRTDKSSITGPISPTEYESRKDRASGIRRWFTRRGNSLLIWPIMGGGEEIAFQFQSTNFCQSAGGTHQSAWLADTDTGRLSEELITLGVIHRFLEADGQPSVAARADFERRMQQEIRNDFPNPRVLAAGDIFGTGRRFTGEPGANNQAGGFESDIWGGGGGGTWG